MKAIIVNDDHIISLENVKDIKLREDGTGSQRNPFRYWIVVYYTNGKDVITEHQESKAKVQEYFNQMFQIITAK